MNQYTRTPTLAEVTPALKAINWVVLISSGVLVISGIALIEFAPDRVFLHLLGILQEIFGACGGIFGMRALVKLRQHLNP